jgi:hypothetical protein
VHSQALGPGRYRRSYRIKSLQRCQRKSLASNRRSRATSRRLFIIQRLVLLIGALQPRTPIPPAVRDQSSTGSGRAVQRQSRLHLERARVNAPDGVARGGTSCSLLGLAQRLVSLSPLQHQSSCDLRGGVLPLEFIGVCDAHHGVATRRNLAMLDEFRPLAEGAGGRTDVRCAKEARARHQGQFRWQGRLQRRHRPSRPEAGRDAPCCRCWRCPPLRPSLSSTKRGGWAKVWASVMPPPQRTTPTRRVAPLCIQLGYPPSFRVTPARMRIIIPPNEIPIPLYRW